MRVRTPRGFAILIVLWTLVLVSMIMTSVVASGRQEAQLAGNLRAAAQVSAIAKGGIYLAIFHLLEPAPAHWNADGLDDVANLDGVRLDIRITSEATKVNLNTGRAEVLSALLHDTGMPEEGASATAANIIAWRSAPGQAIPMAAAYRAAGMNYAPPNEPFESVSELRNVLGITLSEFRRISPYLTIYHNGDTDPLDSAPVVRQALKDVYGSIPVSGKSEPDENFVSIRAEARSHGARAICTAIIRMGPLPDGSLYKILNYKDGS